MNLMQRDRTVEEYAAEFIRLSRFAPRLVEDEEDKGNHFQQGLKPKIRKFLTSQQLDTYSQVLTAARKVDIEFEEDDQDT